MRITSVFFEKFYFSAVVLLLFIVWIELSPASFSVYGGEDYIIENLTAVFFFISSIGFFITAKRSNYLKSRNTKLAYVMIIAWALLMFIFCGEEISWGQRILGFSTPEALAKINLQDEFTFHNIDVIDNAFGGKYRYLSVMMILTGIVFPLMALTTPGKKLFQKFCYPVCPLSFMLFFLGSYIFGKYYAVWNPMEMHDPNSISEAREFIFSLGMVCFALYGAWKPNALFLEQTPPR